MPRKFVITTVIVSALALSSCNTVKGVGRDIESVGEADDKVI